MAARKSQARKRTARSARSGVPKTIARKNAGVKSAGGKSAGGKSAGRAPERRQRTPETLRLRAIQPTFTVGDIERSIRFYSDVLGFVVGERWTSDAGALMGVRLKAGTCELGLAQDDWAKGRDRAKGVGVRLWCTTVQDIDVLAARIKAAGTRLTEGPTDLPWGGRSLSVDDPDGFHLTLYKEK